MANDLSADLASSSVKPCYVPILAKAIRATQEPASPGIRVFSSSITPVSVERTGFRATVQSYVMVTESAAFSKKAIRFAAKMTDNPGWVSDPVFGNNQDLAALALQRIGISNIVIICIVVDPSDLEGVDEVNPRLSGIIVDSQRIYTPPITGDSSLILVQRYGANNWAPTPDDAPTPLSPNATRRHEIWHSLVYAILTADNLGGVPTGNRWFETSLRLVGRPCWEAVANALADSVLDLSFRLHTNKLATLWLEAECKDRFLGNVPSVLNTLLWGLMLRLALGNKCYSVEDLKYSATEDSIATARFLQALYGCAQEYSSVGEELTGIAAQTALKRCGRLDVKGFLGNLKILGPRFGYSYLSGTRLSRPFADALAQIWENYVHGWEPFGSDSFAKPI